MSGNNEQGRNKRGSSSHRLKFFGTVPGKATLRKAKNAVIACICVTLIFAVLINIPLAYAAWFNDNSEISEVDIDTRNGIVETEAATPEPSSFGSFVTALSNSRLEYIVYVDGIEAGAVSSIDVLNDILDEFVTRYTTEKTVSTDIEQNISTKCVYTESPVFFSADRLRRALDPNNLGSECRLTIRTVEVYDTNYVVPFETAFIEDPELYEGETELRTEGVEGFITETSSDTLINGEVIESSIINSETLTEKVDEVIANGTKPLTASNGYYIWPTDGILTSDFGPRSVAIGSSFHKGIDIAGQYAQDIWAADGGEVIYADWSEGYGYFVKIQHDNGEITCYGHCCELLVSEGERVCQGQVIAHMGSTGTASAIHLHFEIRVDNLQIDPLPFLP